MGKLRELLARWDEASQDDGGVDWPAVGAEAGLVELGRVFWGGRVVGAEFEVVEIVVRGGCGVEGGEVRLPVLDGAAIRGKEFFLADGHSLGYVRFIKKTDTHPPSQIILPHDDALLQPRRQRHVTNVL